MKKEEIVEIWNSIKDIVVRLQKIKNKKLLGMIIHDLIHIMEGIEDGFHSKEFDKYFMEGYEEIIPKKQYETKTNKKI